MTINHMTQRHHRCLTAVVLAGVFWVCQGCQPGEQTVFERDAGINERVVDVSEVTPDLVDGREEDVVEPPACDDEREPDDDPERAAAWSAGERLDGKICAGDSDWLTMPLSRGERVRVVLEFEHDDGDLDMILYDPDLRQVQRAESTEDREVVSALAEQAGQWWVQIYGFGDDEGPYEVELQVEASGSGPCEDDLAEDDDRHAQARQVLPPETVSGVICGGDLDWVGWLAQEGQSMRAVLDFEHEVGDLDIALFDEGGRVVAESASSDDGEALTYEAARAGLHLLRIQGYGGAAAPYDLSVTLNGVAEDTVVVEGELLFDDPFLDRGAYIYLRRPLAGVDVEVIDELSGQVIGQSVTDGQGRYRVSVEATPGAPIYARALARRRGPEGKVDVVNSQRRLYAVRSDTVALSASGATLDLALTRDARLHEPFNVLDAHNQAMGWWALNAVAAPVPLLHIVWEAGRSFDCGTCYRGDFSPPTVFLLGRDSDNDALDDPVILHEVGHHLMNTFGTDDSPGGFHDGTPVDPLLAYAEGWATAFSTWVRDDPLYYDTFGESASRYDMERPDEDYSDFAGGSVSAPISEYLVAALLWDFYDAVEDGEDRVALGASVTQPVLGYLVDGQRARRGVEGVDLVDYLDALHCEDLLDEGPLLSRLEEAGFPYSLPGGCKPMAPAVMRWEASASVLRLESRRPVDGLTLHGCLAPGQCVRVADVGKLDAGQVVRVALAEGSARVEVEAVRWWEARLWRGEATWVAVEGVEGDDLASSASQRAGALRWHKAPPAGDGHPVLEASVGGL